MKYKINLFPEPERNAVDKITYFALHYLRYILVITQLVAIIVFFFRFKVDQDIVDLKEKLTQQRSILTSANSMLDQVKEIDTKTKNIREIIEVQNNFQNQYFYLYSKINPDLNVSILSIDSQGVKITGSSSNVDSIKKMYESIKTENKFKIINLENIDKKDGSYDFNLSLSEFK